MEERVRSDVIAANGRDVVRGWYYISFEVKGQSGEERLLRVTIPLGKALQLAEDIQENLRPSA